MELKLFFKDIIRRIIGEIPTSTLIKRGLIVGKNFNRQQGCFIDPTHCWLIEIGDNVTMSIRVVLMAHDASTKNVTGYTKIGKIKIGDNVFIGANSLILPNVTIGENSIIGANSVVTKDIPSNCIVAGNPAKVIGSLKDFKVKNENMIHIDENVFSSEYTMRTKITREKKIEMKLKLDKGVGFVE
ncbi:acyltransferase [Turicibacter bilis]|uniref:Acyltransferase n=1 Tax=Turicibacter bilis TaxID=2735723 RepID=A0ABY5JK91_9FIRM|nr:acyltransferase [Turicibacter bilis]MBS3200932.1 acyltransferase [Turicibacter bilis]UUF07109.1 acyltransferase [Turicibacter bilis]